MASPFQRTSNLWDSPPWSIQKTLFDAPQEVPRRIGTHPDDPDSRRNRRGLGLSRDDLERWYIEINDLAEEVVTDLYVKEKLQDVRDEIYQYLH